MKHQWLDQAIKYDGLQMNPIWTYQNFGVMGDSIVAFRGPCQIPAENILDIEDLRAHQKIQGADMLHFIVEVFHQSFPLAVTLQRLMVCMAQKTIQSEYQISLDRQGDDLYFEKRKLSISIAAISSVSAKIHLALNISNEGTPVPTCCLSEFGIDPKKFGEDLMASVVHEWKSILEATWKVKLL